MAVPETPAAEATAGSAATPQRPNRPPRRPHAYGAPAGGGLVDTVLGLLTSTWLWIAAALVLIASLLVARRRSASQEAAPVRGAMAFRTHAAAAAAPAAFEDDGNDILVEEPAAGTARGGVERRAVPRDDEESPLERTISSEGPLKLDQADPLAEADFHMAYGLYDQAADLLTAATGARARPARSAAEADGRVLRLGEPRQLPQAGP